MSVVLSILYGALLTLCASMALGLTLFRLGSIRFHKTEHQVFAFLAGSASLSLLLFLLGTLHLYRRGVLQVFALALIAAGLWAWRGTKPLEVLPKISRVWLVLFGVALAVFGVHYFFNALAPEVSPDGSGYHLEIVAEYLRNRGLVAIPTNMYANMPGGLEMLFLLAFCFGRHSAAALVHFGFLLTLPFLLLCFGRRFGHPRAGLFAALLAFATPVFGIDGSSAYNDVALATTAFAVFYLLQLWDENRERALLPLIGLLAGFCFAIKYTGVFMTIYAVCFVAWRLLRTKQVWWRRAAVVAGVGAIVIVPWLIKNWIWAGNPLSPFYNSIFPNPYVTITFEREYRDVLGRFTDGDSRWKGLIDAAISGRLSEGLLGPTFLLAPLALLSLRYRIGRRALLASALFLPGYIGNYGGRFLIPSAPFIGIALGLALESSRGMLPLVLIFHLITCWYKVVPVYAGATAWRLRQTPHRAALRWVSEESYFVRKLPGWVSASMIESTLPPGATVLSAEPIPEAYTSRRVIVGFQSAIGRTLQEILQTPLESLPEQPRREFRFHFPARRLRAIRVRQTAPRDLAEWSISEIRVWQGTRELPRSASWRPKASVNPWEANLAIDDSYVTRWNSREPLRPDMTFELDFGAPEEIDMTTLEASDGQPIKLKLEGLDASGVWKELSAKPQLAVSRAPLDLRRAATQALKARGIYYILIKDTEPAAKEYSQHTEAWGITEIAERNGARLYHLD